MRVVLQRVKKAKVDVDGNTIGEIQQGLLIFVGITHTDQEDIVRKLAKKCVELRIFEDEDGNMNKSMLDGQGAILSISQSTLYGDCRKGRRPSFTDAAKKEIAKPLYHLFNEALRSYGIHVETGEFGADMNVTLVNDGPITLVLDSDDF